LKLRSGFAVGDRCINIAPIKCATAKTIKTTATAILAVPVSCALGWRAGGNLTLVGMFISSPQQQRSCRKRVANSPS
jgi:hypothetical protein